ncbi:MAG: tetratricopeptide repeat protein [Terriglobia bacterium]
MSCAAVLIVALAVLPPPQAAKARPQARPTPPKAARFEQLSRAAEQARQANRDAEAILLYQQALALKPEWEEGLWYLSTLEYDKARYAEARDLLRRYVGQQPKAGPGWALLGLCEFQTREYARALDHLRQGMTLGVGGSKGLERSLFYYAAVLLTRFEMYDESLRLLFEMARSGQVESFLVEPAGLAALRLPLLPGEIPSDRKELVRLAGEGALAENNQRHDEAEKLFRSMAASAPNEPGVHFLLGAFLLNIRPEEGVREIQRELEISPFHVPARIRLAAEYVRQGKVDQGLAFAQEAVNLEPKNATAHMAAGDARVAKGDLSGGIRELETARDLAPEIVGIRWALFRAYTSAGQSESARQEKAAIEKLIQPGTQP